MTTTVLAGPVATTPGTAVLTIPSPTWTSWQLGPFTVHAYALCIIAGIVIAVWLGDRRWKARGGEPGVVGEVALWAVPFGIVGGRLYHVISSPDAYFGSGGHPIDAFKVWQGGLGIWGAVALGGVGAWIGCRRLGVPLPPFGDAIAPGIAIAQGIGRWGNWFNQELFGGPTTLPWGLQIDPQHRPAGYADVATYHPTFLYESVWDIVIVAGVVLWADKRFRLGHGRAFALYVALYCVGRFFIELMRVDPATLILGVRINVFVSALVFLGAVVYLVVSARLRPGRESPEELQSRRRGEPAASEGRGDADTGADTGAHTGADEATREGAGAAMSPTADDEEEGKA
jgi:prolipoprotein diacylglyceryl transferase